eukprot:364446-Chlamydomonas_euryale.AAC.3
MSFCSDLKPAPLVQPLACSPAPTPMLPGNRGCCPATGAVARGGCGDSSVPFYGCRRLSVPLMDAPSAPVLARQLAGDGHMQGCLQESTGLRATQLRERTTQQDGAPVTLVSRRWPTSRPCASPTSGGQSRARLL